jgi:hypothetical protein
MIAKKPKPETKHRKKRTTKNKKINVKYELTTNQQREGRQNGV